MPQDRGRRSKRQVRDDSKRLPRQLDASGVLAHDVDVLPPAAQTRGQAHIQLDGKHTPRNASELGGQPAAAGTEVEHKVVAAEPRIANELRGERA